jgi:hypothetical protein
MSASTHTFEGTSDYRVVPMHRGVESAAPVFGRALSAGINARQDPDRKDFYTVDVGGVSYYFHIFRETRTAYLLFAETQGLGFAPTETQAATAGCHPC